MNQDDEASKITFDTEASTSSYQAIKLYREATTPKIIKWTMKCFGGVIKKERQAEYFLLAFSMLVFAISWFLLFGVPDRNKSLNDKAALERLLKMHPVSIAQ